MKRSLSVCALMFATAAALSAQQSHSNPYEGVSNPPPDSTITTPAPQPRAKPSPAHRMQPGPQPAPAPASPAPAASSDPGSSPIAVPDIVTGPAADSSNAVDTEPASATPALAPQSVDGTDSGIVRVEPAPQPGQQVQPALSHRGAGSPDGDIVHVQPGNPVQPALDGGRDAANPDGDIVHPAPLPPGTLASGTMIRARLLERLSTAHAEDGDKFRARVASDVLDSAGNVVIPAGAEIDGTVGQVSTGHFAGHGSMLLHPRAVILPNGTQYRLYAQLSGTPGSTTHVGDEGSVTPGVRTRKGEMEYGGGVGVGAVTGAALGGPVGALAGTLVGAGLVTVHLMMDHPQATLETGTVLLFNLTEPLHMVAANTPQGE